MSNKKKTIHAESSPVIVLSLLLATLWTRKTSNQSYASEPFDLQYFLCGSSLNIDSQSSLCPALSVSVSFTHPATSLIVSLLLWAYDAAQPLSEDHSAHHLMFSWSLQPAIAEAEKITTFNSAT